MFGNLENEYPQFENVWKDGHRTVLETRIKSSWKSWIWDQNLPKKWNASFWKSCIGDQYLSKRWHDNLVLNMRAISTKKHEMVFSDLWSFEHLKRRNQETSKLPTFSCSTKGCCGGKAGWGKAWSELLGSFVCVAKNIANLLLRVVLWARRCAHTRAACENLARGWSAQANGLLPALCPTCTFN